ncbi:GntR family transcriptional regulator [Rugamonas sp. CCM 8940]|uniref:GntR family transcriptional regulator n=1 Tax=Rugamonas sp. CCM 8940 TaxID=2765359 RepID=UPI0018F3A3DF|nr:GntR family transcriptional regulator [Rugamonas sp. CCM 8940]MBJ7312206.1 GntR family transcriptional regulator [Rugamonas sp. CCM 8940]
MNAVIPASAPLVRKNITSMYEQIAHQLRNEALGGLYEPSGKMPSEAQLGERFAVSRVTVRLALDQLAQEGTVQRKQGKGTYVAGKQVRHALDAVRSFHDSLLLQGLRPNMRLLTKELVPLPEHLRALFGADVDECLLLRRLHLVDGEPIALGSSYLPAQAAALSWAETECQPNYALLRRLDGQGVARADVAVGAQLAERQQARLLRVRSGSALLVMTRTSRFANGDCCDHSTFHIRPERYTFTASCSFQA